jgi:hypothetical protein
MRYLWSQPVSERTKSRQRSGGLGDLWKSTPALSGVRDDYPPPTGDGSWELGDATFAQPAGCIATITKQYLYESSAVNAWRCRG